MPSWAKSYWIAFWSVIAGLLLSIFWIIIAGLVLATYFFSYVERVGDHFEKFGFSGIINLGELFVVGGILIFFLILSSLSFYAVLVKYTWNEVSDEIKKELDELKQKLFFSENERKKEIKVKKPKKGNKFCVNCDTVIPEGAVFCPRCRASQI